jgi:hypothetical protein
LIWLGIEYSQIASNPDLNLFNEIITFGYRNLDRTFGKINVLLLCLFVAFMALGWFWCFRHCWGVVTVRGLVTVVLISISLVGGGVSNPIIYVVYKSLGGLWYHMGVRGYSQFYVLSGFLIICGVKVLFNLCESLVPLIQGESFSGFYHNKVKKYISSSLALLFLVLGILRFPVFGTSTLPKANFPAAFASSVHERLFFRQIRSVVPSDAAVVSQPLKVAYNLQVFQQIASSPTPGGWLPFLSDYHSFYDVCKAIKKKGSDVYFMELKYPKVTLPQLSAYSDFHVMDMYPVKVLLSDGDNYLYKLDCEVKV